MFKKPTGYYLLISPNIRTFCNHADIEKLKEEEVTSAFIYFYILKCRSPALEPKNYLSPSSSPYYLKFKDKNT